MTSPLTQKEIDQIVNCWDAAITGPQIPNKEATHRDLSKYLDISATSIGYHVKKHFPPRSRRLVKTGRTASPDQLRVNPTFLHPLPGNAHWLEEKKRVAKFHSGLVADAPEDSLAAIQLMCTVCKGEGWSGPKNCKLTECPLWPFRWSEDPE